MLIHVLISAELFSCVKVHVGAGLPVNLAMPVKTRVVEPSGQGSLY